MTDIFDQATEREERDREQSLKTRMQEGPKPTGRCYNCWEELGEGRRFCNAGCRDDWQKRQRK